MSYYELIESNKPIVMGILNTTPDSFSDGGQYEHIKPAVDHALQMLKEGADIIDIGGESTRPGAQAVSLEEELQRVIPVIQGIREISDCLISIDTSKPEVMRAAIEAGASMVNDVNGLQAPGALEVCAELAVPVCVMHMQGEPRIMQNNPEYENVVDDLQCFFQQRIKACLEAGIELKNIMIDPGFGFGKTLEHNLLLLKHLGQFQTLEVPMLVGLSRKSMFGAILGGAPVEERLSASVSAAVLCRTKGADIFRVHDVKATVDALKVCEAVEQV